MNKYAASALKAVSLYGTNKAQSPVKAWELATIAEFGAGTSGQKKSCPRDAFLGLCEDGLIIGIPKGVYTKSIANKSYVIDAVNLLRKYQRLAQDPLALWKSVLRGVVKQHNSQMDVVAALWINRLIR